MVVVGHPALLESETLSEFEPGSAPPEQHPPPAELELLLSTPWALLGDMPKKPMAIKENPTTSMRSTLSLMMALCLRLG
jgi:hypothetical protein